MFLNRYKSRLLFCALQISGACLSAKNHPASIVVQSGDHTKKKDVCLAYRLALLQAAYPQYIRFVCDEYIEWYDGTTMDVEQNDYTRPWHEKVEQPSLVDQVLQDMYMPGVDYCQGDNGPVADSGRIRYEPFFRKMYGNSPQEVESKLVPVAWMPRIFGSNTYTLLVTTVNNVHERIRCISGELEELAVRNPVVIQFLENPGGTYCWRFIANTERLSNHSFGMTLDINAERSEYWQWDLVVAGEIICEDSRVLYRNSVPFEIVEIFEKYGFIWGGKWYHYDTMHFEYRPELFVME